MRGNGREMASDGQRDRIHIPYGTLIFETLIFARESNLLVKGKWAA